MTLEEARRLLVQYNYWRRDEHIPNAYEMPNPKEIGVAIDLAIDILGGLNELTESDEDLKGLAAREAQG